MGLKILGGMAKGHTINIPKGDKFRPTSIRLKRRLFDFRQDWEGYTFVDLCAGSGSVGLESWSRGADQLFLIENNKQTFSLLKKNIEQLKKKYTEKMQCHNIQAVNKSAKTWVTNTLPQVLDEFENVVLFFDPPYHDSKLYQDVFHHVYENYTNRSLEFWIESDRTKGIPLEKWVEMGGEPLKSYLQGTSFLILFEP
jgi:16S rRNA (guanine966-N2)-methyltransferase